MIIPCSATHSPSDSRKRGKTRKEWIMKAAVLTTYGDPATGLEYRDVPEPGKPGVGQVLVGVEFAPINFSDILVARGLYPLRPDLPSVIGNEGVGRVLETGQQVGPLTWFSCRKAPILASLRW
jgi:D-arabinose 1-dehydrogenase-like Zn-dependent alcohol dehydrogenase